MPRITHFLLSCPSAAELSSSNPERQTVLRRTPQKLSWRFCGRNHTLTNRHRLAAARGARIKSPLWKPRLMPAKTKPIWWMVTGGGTRLESAVGGFCGVWRGGNKQRSCLVCLLFARQL